MFKTVGHHAMENRDEVISYREKLGPVKSKMKEQDGTMKKIPPFAGDGYYFWDDNIVAARWWGKLWYEKHLIFKLDFELDHENGKFLDMVGSRSHINLFKELIDVIKSEFGNQCDKWGFLNYILALQKKEKETPGIFPFNILRFNDIKSGLGNRKVIPILPKNIKKDNSIELNPYYIICVFDIHKNGFQSFELEEKYPV